MLHIKRRHLPTCKQKKLNAKCMCPVWVDGMQDGRRIRYSLDTSNWEEASRRLLEITSGESAKKDSSIKDAVKDFISEKERQEIKSTKKYSEVLNPLTVYCDARAITTIRALDLQTIRVFLDSLGDSARTKGKKIERLRAFFRHCEELDWCDSNPALKLKKPMVTTPPVVPFTEEHKKPSLRHHQIPHKNSFGYDNRARMRAFVWCSATPL